MKRFEDLSEAQKKKAVNVAKFELQECIALGFVAFEKVLTEYEIEEYALAAAEIAWYAETEDKVIYDIAGKE